MAKYRKKPVVIDAYTFDEFVAIGQSAVAEVMRGIPWSFDFTTCVEDDKGNRHYKIHPITHENDDCYLIPTLEGTMKFNRGEMLIVGVKGEVYPCKADIFEATYDPA